MGAGHPGQPRGKEYHLNHIYAPYFEISYRKKRRLDISPNDFNQLVEGTDDKQISQVVRKLSRSKALTSLDDLLHWEDEQGYQLDFWSANDSK